MMIGLDKKVAELIEFPYRETQNRKWKKHTVTFLDVLVAIIFFLFADYITTTVIFVFYFVIYRGYVTPIAISSSWDVVKWVVVKIAEMAFCAWLTVKFTKRRRKKRMTRMIVDEIKKWKEQGYDVKELEDKLEEYGIEVR